MTIEVFDLFFKTNSGLDVIDLTSLAKDKLGGSEILSGVMTLFITGSTKALTTIEYEDGVINDLKKSIERIAPEYMSYNHDERWGVGNGYSHVGSELLGPSLNIPFVGDRRALGPWRQIVLLGFDNLPGDQHIIIQLMG
jgi:secondary thiamine-phosphate synthase enzyme